MAAPISLEGEIWADRRSGSASMWSLGETVFSWSSTLRREQDDEEALKWAALEKLATYDRLQTAIMRSVGDNGKGSFEEIDVTKLGYEDRQHIIEKILKITEEDNEWFLLKLHDRIDRDMDIPLTEKGIMEALARGNVICEIDFDIIFTSHLVRSKQTALITMTQAGLPDHQS